MQVRVPTHPPMHRDACRDLWSWHTRERALYEDGVPRAPSGVCSNAGMQWGGDLACLVPINR
jgi:hypothetical protein